jgi:hypothetical protein
VRGCDAPLVIKGYLPPFTFTHSEPNMSRMAFSKSGIVTVPSLDLT